VTRKRGLVRCHWAKTDLSVDYHDHEWGLPLHDDRALFEFLILEGAQAGLSWETILKKRENYRKAMDRFDPEKMARYDGRKIRSLLADPGIVRNRLKIEAAIANAKAALRVRDEFGKLDAFLWRFVGHKSKVNRWRSMSQIPATTPQSDTMSRELRQRGFRFVGPTICYAFMQAVGMVNDHLVSCFRHAQVRGK
jgi:DNA-3-methyladenine glycosylase I